MSDNRRIDRATIVAILEPKRVTLDWSYVRIAQVLGWSDKTYRDSRADAIELGLYQQSETRDGR